MALFVNKKGFIYKIVANEGEQHTRHQKYSCYGAMDS